MIPNSDIISIFAEWKMEVLHEGQILFENKNIIENNFNKLTGYLDSWTFGNCITSQPLPDESYLIIKIKISKWIVTTAMDFLD